MRELFDLYDPGMRRHSEPRIVPLCAPVADIRAAALPPTAIIAAELDVLADDSRALAGMLKAAGVPHRLHVEPGVTHGFINRGRLVPSADACLDRAATFLADLS
jgi:acetyl esterase